MKSHARQMLALAVAVAFTAATALGQSAPPAASQRPEGPSATVGNPAEAVAAQFRTNTGGSLLQSALAAQSDPNRVKPERVSYIAVPVPEPRKIRKHDLVTIVIREQSEASSSGKSELTKDASFDAQLTNFIRLNLGNLSVDPNGVGATPPRITATGSRSFKGDGKVDRSDNFTARVTAEVLDVKPNGTLVLQARKRIKNDDEEQLFVLSGVCRAEDIVADNTVLSTQIYDMELTKSSKGTVRESTKRGFLPKLLDAVNPF